MTYIYAIDETIDEINTARDLMSIAVARKTKTSFKDCKKFMFHINCEIDEKLVEEGLSYLRSEIKYDIYKLNSEINKNRANIRKADEDIEILVSYINEEKLNKELEDSIKELKKEVDKGRKLPYFNDDPNKHSTEGWPEDLARIWQRIEFLQKVVSVVNGNYNVTPDLPES